jgi:hypothetical protein
MATEGLTVGELANLIRRPEDDPTQVLTRLRNWTKQGLLSPAGEQSPGTGKWHRYSPSAVLQAMILGAVVNTVGVNATKFAKLFDEKFYRAMARAKRRYDEFGATLTLVVLFRTSSTASDWHVWVADSDDVQDYLVTTPIEVHIVINLDILFEKMFRCAHPMIMDNAEARLKNARSIQNELEARIKLRKLEAELNKASNKPDRK